MAKKPTRGKPGGEEAPGAKRLTKRGQWHTNDFPRTGRVSSHRILALPAGETPTQALHRLLEQALHAVRLD
jgi:hypothetical protein